MRKAILLTLFSGFASLAFGQGLGNPIAVSPSVGDTLRLIQREHYRLLPALDGFQWAVFYLTKDSSLNVRVRIKDKDGTSVDSAIMNYGNLSSLLFRLREIDSLSNGTVEILLKDGILIKGIVLNETKDSIVVETEYVGTVSIPKSKIEKFSRWQESAAPNDLSTGPDPNKVSEFAMPTGNTIPKGMGYVGDYELFFLEGGMGLTDWLMANLGLLIVPIPIQDQVINYGLKARIYQVPDKFSLAVGLQLITPFDGSGSSGMWYGAVTIGNDERKGNVAFGTTFGPNGASTPILALSADDRIGEHTKFLAEGWFFTNEKYGLLMFGVRFFGRNLSGDIGMMYPVGQNFSIGSPIGWPVGNLVYTF